MSLIEEEIRNSLAQQDEEEKVTEIISEEDAYEDKEQSFREEVESIPESDLIIEDKVSGNVEEDSKVTLKDVSDEFKNIVDTVNEITSGNGLKRAISEQLKNTQVEEASEDDNDHEMTIEEINDVPATNLSITDEEAKAVLKENYDVEAADAIQLIGVMNRYKAGEKFDVFEALPNSIKKVIVKEAISAGADKSTINFFAKSFINDLVNNTFIDREIKDFNEELKETLAPMGNIAGTIMDEYSDDIYHKFTDQLEDKAKEIEGENPEKAKQLNDISKSFREAISLTRILDKVEKNPSVINIAYKEARDNWAKFCKKYNEKIATVKPIPREIKFYEIGLTNSGVFLGYPEGYLKTVVVLIANSVMEAIDTSIKDDNIVEHVYAYYVSNAVYTIAFTANNSEVYDITSKALIDLTDKVDAYMQPLLARNSKKNKKRNKKK